MKKIFVVAYISFFDNELSQTKVEAVSPLAAAKKHLIGLYSTTTAEELKELKSMEDIKQYCFDCDSMIDVIEV